MKVSRATSDMMRNVNGTIARNPLRRRIIDKTPSATIEPKAHSASWRAAGSAAPRVSASTSWPENTGMNRSATVAPNRPPATVSARTGWLSQCRRRNGITTPIAAGRLSIGAVMSSSGHAHARAGSIMSTHGGEGAECVRRQKNQWFSGSSGSGCRPDRRCRKTPSKGESGIRLGMRRGDLRIRHNHAHPPRFERQRAPYKCIVALLQYIWAGNVVSR